LLNEDQLMPCGGRATARFVFTSETSAGDVLMHLLRILHRGFLVLSLGGVCCLIGCGGSVDDRPEVAAVSGKVTYKGGPVAGASVIFRSEGSPRVASGVTDDKGEYKLTTFDTDDGAVVGDHAVILMKNAPAGDLGMPKDPSPEDYAKMMAESKSDGRPGFETESLLPSKYSDPETSGLTRSVVAGEKNEFNFDLTDD
jgi:hypothetical protein